MPKIKNKNKKIKSRDITLQTNVHIVKAMAFPVNRRKGWTVKKAERGKTDAFELWC